MRNYFNNRFQSFTLVSQSETYSNVVPLRVSGTWFQGFKLYKYKKHYYYYII
jgi:hypothetical protein